MSLKCAYCSYETPTRGLALNKVVTQALRLHVRAKHKVSNKMKWAPYVRDINNKKMYCFSHRGGNEEECRRALRKGYYVPLGNGKGCCWTCISL